MGAQQKAKAKTKTEAEAPRSESPSPSGKRRAPAAAGDRGAGRQKKRKKAHSTRDVAAAQGAAGPASAGALHPFEHDPADDCETCFQAYQDIAPFLQKLAQRLGKTKQELCIWDPYYCAGKVKVHLRKLGFSNVVNENQDFYALTEYPPFDVLLTSPPYSKNHIQKCMEFAVSCGKAWFILQPQYVHRKAYYAALVSQQDPLFMIPGRKYVYYAHHGGRKDNTTVICRHWARDRRCPLGDACKYFHGEEKDARAAAPALPASASSSDLVPVTPFKSIWHIHMGSAGAGAPTLNDKTFTWALQKLRKSGNTLYRTAATLPHNSDLSLPP